jgi:hypothetical protein
MKIVLQEEAKLILRERPVLIWILASIFGATGLFILAQPYMTTLTCNRIEPCKLERSTLLGSKSEQIPLNTLQGAEVVRNDGASQLVIRTSNNKISFGSASSFGESQKQEIASDINDFITNPKIPSLREQYDERLPSFLFGGIFVTVFFVIVYSSPVVTYVFDKTLNTLTISPRDLFGKKVIQARLSEIEDVQVETGSDDTYRVSIVLVSGKRLPLTLYYSSGRESKQQIALHIKNFLNLK